MVGIPGIELTLEANLRRKLFLTIGQAMLAVFLLLRFTNLYGDMAKWTSQPTSLFTFMSFLNVTKYPPSLLYILMTLGPAITFLGLWKKEHGGLAQPFITFGRVPLFYYVLHLFLLHAMAATYSYVMSGTSAWLFSIPYSIDAMGGPPPQGWGVDLPMVYVFWITAVLILYPLCKRFAEYKRTHNQTWLSYV